MSRIKPVTRLASTASDATPAERITASRCGLGGLLLSVLFKEVGNGYDSRVVVGYRILFVGRMQSIVGIAESHEDGGDAELDFEVAHDRDRSAAAREYSLASQHFGHLADRAGSAGPEHTEDEELGADTVAAAMNFVNNTDALIIDMRSNGGGNPAMVALVCSYLFGAEPVHLNDLYWREGDSTHQWWTLPYVPGKRYGDKRPVYLLTAKRTFSAAEEFTYNLKNLKRATIIGETTGGGAHPGGVFRINEHFGMFVPTGRAISPITKTNWEGTGVTPDISVPADQALLVARSMALKKQLTNVTDSDIKVGIQDEIAKVEKELNALKTKSE